MAPAAAEEEELEVAVTLCDLKRILRARDRRRRRLMRQQKQRAEVDSPPLVVAPSWGRRRLRSVLEDIGKGVVAEERDGGAASPDTPLVFPDSVTEEEDDEARKDRAQDEWVQVQRGVVARLSQENADLLKQIHEYRARLLSSRTANESLKQLHKVRQQREREEQHARMMRALALLRRGPTTATATDLDLNEPAARAAEARRRRLEILRPAPPTDLELHQLAAQERCWQEQQQRRRQQLHRAAVTAEARRRRLGILRAKPLLSSCRTRHVVG